MNWLTTIADELERRNPEGQIVVSSGVSPSGVYHLGTLREVMTAEIIARELRLRGREVKHAHLVDDLDVYRKVPAGIPETYKQYLGWPLSDIPSPDGVDGKSYADYYLQDLLVVADKLHMQVDIIRAHEQYRSGAYTQSIEKALLAQDKIKAVLEGISGRQLDERWTPVQVIEDGYLKSRHVTAVDTESKIVTYVDRDDVERQADYSKGEVKLDWRTDWPARWWHFGVDAEPFGRDHATKGGSYDTGVGIVREVYDAEPPIPVPYAFVNRTGDTKKMSKSAGDTITAVELMRMLPAEVVWFFLMRYAPEKQLFFDEGPTLMRLVDEFGELLAKVDKTPAEEQLIRLCMHGVADPTVSRVPFSLLIASYQSALKDVDRTLEIIGRTEYADVAREDAAIIRRELVFLDEWLQSRAPEEVTFALTDTVEATAFTEAERAFMFALADKITQAPTDADGTWFHEAIYAFKESSGLAPKDLFSTLYRATIGKDRGPRAGWFLSILPRDWLIVRLRLQDATVGSISLDASTDAVSVELSTDLDEQHRFAIDNRVVENFPGACVGYLVADLTTVNGGDGAIIDKARATLQSSGVTVENLSQQPQIDVWRKAFQTFGVKPSNYLSSAEALAKRALKGNAAYVSPIVDAYNAVSMKFLVPMGAIDLERVHGDISLRYGVSGEKADLLGMDEEQVVTDRQVVYADDQQVITWLWNHRDAKATAVTSQTKRAVFFADSLIGHEAADAAIADLADQLQSIGVRVLRSGVVG